MALDAYSASRQFRTVLDVRCELQQQIWFAFRGVALGPRCNRKLGTLVIVRALDNLAHRL